MSLITIQRKGEEFTACVYSPQDPKDISKTGPDDLPLRPAMFNRRRER